MAVVKAPRANRADPELRRGQLIDVALHAFAESGFPGVELKQIAAEVGVTPNLIHHYFPGGKTELHLEAVRLACAELTGLLDTDASVPIGEKMPRNISKYLDEALAPTDRWKLYVRSLRSADEDLKACAMKTRSDVLAGMGANHLGTTSPPPEVRAALFGAFGFVEDAANEWRLLGIEDRAKLDALVIAVMLAALAATASD